MPQVTPPKPHLPGPGALGLLAGQHRVACPSVKALSKGRDTCFCPLPRHQVGQVAEKRPAWALPLLQTSQGVLGKLQDVC